MGSHHLVVGVALLLLTAGTGAAVGVTGASTGGVTDTSTDGGTATPAAGTAAVGTNGPAQTATCDYASLYNRTIDSVVGVRTNAGQGSGFVYQVSETNGTSYVVTNAHVVGDARSVIVQFSTEDTRRGEVVGRDRVADLAVVRVSDTPETVEALPVAQSPPDPGRKVAALGSPFGLDESITHGIVSGVNRSLPTTQGAAIPTTIQTDAPINPGNSGGPLVTCDGTVVGVNTAGVPAARGDNVGFAVSSTLVQQVVPSLLRTGDYEHAFLGVTTTPITPGLVTANELGVTGGVYVHRVASGSPASGVLQGSTGSVVVDGTRVPVGGDVIVGIDGRAVNSTEDLSRYLLTEARPGDTVTLTVVRDGTSRQVTVTLGARPDPPSQ